MAGDEGELNDDDDDELPRQTPESSDVKSDSMWDDCPRWKTGWSQTTFAASRLRDLPRAHSTSEFPTIQKLARSALTGRNTATAAAFVAGNQLRDRCVAVNGHGHPWHSSRSWNAANQTRGRQIWLGSAAAEGESGSFAMRGAVESVLGSISASTIP